MAHQLGKIFFECVCETVKDLEVPWTKVNGVTPNGTPSMTGNKIGLMGRIRREVEKKKSQFFQETSLNHPPTVTLWRNFEV
jgi:hypothetical protein